MFSHELRPRVTTISEISTGTAVLDSALRQPDLAERSYPAVAAAGRTSDCFNLGMRPIVYLSRLGSQSPSRRPARIPPAKLGALAYGRPDRPELSPSDRASSSVFLQTKQTKLRDFPSKFTGRRQRGHSGKGCRLGICAALAIFLFAIRAA